MLGVKWKSFKSVLGQRLLFLVVYVQEYSAVLFFCLKVLGKLCVPWVLQTFGILMSGCNSIQSLEFVNTSTVQCVLILFAFRYFLCGWIGIWCTFLFAFYVGNFWAGIWLVCFVVHLGSIDSWLMGRICCCRQASGALLFKHRCSVFLWVDFCTFWLQGSLGAKLLLEIDWKPMFLVQHE